MTLSVHFNPSAMFARGNLRQVDHSMQSVLSRLSSGLRIQRAADDPSGLVQANLLRHHLSGVEQASNNMENGVNLLQTAEGSMDEVSSLLNRMRELVLNAANLGPNNDGQQQALQDEFDAAVASIDRIAVSTRFGSLSLLTGDFGQNTLDDVSLKSYRSAGFDATRLPAGIREGSALTIGSPQGLPLDDQGNPVFARERLAVTLSTAGGGVPGEDTLLNGLRQDGTTLTVAGGERVVISGPKGTTTINLAADTTIDDFIDLVNAATASTGVTAVFDASSGELGLESSNYGYGPLHVDSQTLGATGLLDPTPGAANSLEATRDGFSMTFAAGGVPATAASLIQGLFTTTSGTTFDDAVGKTFTIAGAGEQASLEITDATTIQDVVDFINEHTTQTGAVATFDPATGDLRVAGTRGPVMMVSEDLTSTGAGVGLLDLRTDRPDDAGATHIASHPNGWLDLQFIDRDGVERTVRLTQVPERDGGLAFVNLAPGPESAPPFTGWEAGAFKVVVRPTVDEGNPFAPPTVTAHATRTSNRTLQSGALSGQQIVLELPDLRAGALGYSARLAGVGLADLQDLVDSKTLRSGRAQEALQVVDAAIAEVSTARGRAGATQANGIEAALANLRVGIENLTNSESRLRDADYAVESAEYARVNILYQAATSMLAQANQLPQTVLQLLR